MKLYQELLYVSCCGDVKIMENQQKQNRKISKSLAQRRRTAIALSVISSLILAGIGFEVVNNSNVPKQQTIESNAQATHAPLRILDDENEIAFNDLSSNDEVSIIQLLTRQKNQQATKIHELKNELEQTKARLRQLKTDILIRGGDKEVSYRQSIAQLEHQLKLAERETQHLKAEISARNRLIDTKRSEVEKLSRVFSETNSQLQENLRVVTSDYAEEKKNTDAALKQIQLELGLPQHEDSRMNNVNTVLSQVKNRIQELEALTKNSVSKDVVSETLSTQQVELEVAQATIATLLQQLKIAEQRSEVLQGELHDTTETVYTPDHSQKEEGNIRNQLFLARARTKDLEGQLLQARYAMLDAENRATELENQVAHHSLMANNSTVGHSNREVAFNHQNSRSSSPQGKAISNQQDRLIRDLEKNLQESDAKNRQLEETIQDLKRNDRAVDNRGNQGTVRSLQQHLSKAEERIKELEKELAIERQADTSRKFTHANQENRSELEAIVKNLKTKLAIAMANMESMQALHEEKLKEQEMKIASISSHQDFIPSIEFDPRSDEKLQEMQKVVTSLKQQLAAALHKNSFESSDDLPFYQERVKVLENAFKAQKKALQAAKTEISTLKETHNSKQGEFTDLETFYSTKLEVLLERNRNLEEQLEEAEDYLKMTQEQLIGDQQNNLSLENQIGAKNKQIKELEEELALLENGNSSLSINRRENEQRISANIERMAHALSDEKEKRLAAEKEIAMLRDEIAENSQQRNEEDSDLDFLFYDDDDYSTKYSEEKLKSDQLQTRLETVSRWAEKLQEELAAYESQNSEEVELDPSQLKAKVAYLSTRLNQEKSKQTNAEEKLEEVMLTFNELKDRNVMLERKVREAGLWNARG